MNNFIEYFYEIKPKKVLNKGNYYSFFYRGFHYRLYIYDINNDFKKMVEINEKLVDNVLMSKIIFNRNNEIISSYNGINYILIKIFINVNKKITLNEINYLALPLKIEKENFNWGVMWENKIDYLEDLINENGKSFPLMVESFNYFVGMAENAIEYFNSIIITNEEKLVVSHKIIKFDDFVDCLYNPLNVIYDYRVRDVAEYIKNAFFNKNYNIFKELFIYLKKNNLSLNEIKLLISRLLYPSFYFDMYNDILIYNKDEKILLDIIPRLDEYEDFLCQVINYLRLYYDVNEIEWLKKRRT